MVKEVNKEIIICFIRIIIAVLLLVISYNQFINFHIAN